MVRYEVAHDIMHMAREIVEKLDMKHVDISRVIFIRSRGSKARNTIARCHGLPKIWQKALGVRAHYIIEVLSEKFDRLNEEQKIKVIIHELMHIPASFGGGYRHHDWVNGKNVQKLYRAYLTKIRESK